jgi:hypothetical protein
MEVLPLTSIFEKLQLTVTSAEIVLTSLRNETEIVLSSEISSLPTYNCNMVFRKMDSNDSMIGQMYFRSGRPLVTAEISVNYKNFEKLEKICSGGEPVRPISLYLKIAKRREIKNGEIIIGNEDFTVDIFYISWRRPLF